MSVSAPATALHTAPAGVWALASGSLKMVSTSSPFPAFSDSRNCRDTERAVML